jgi:nucleotide-binding universal stress UspA family protein
MNRIVVGVDGSESSKDALRWAIDEAQLHGAELIALHAWTFPVMSGPIPFNGVVNDPIDWEAEARESLARTVKEVADGSDISVQTRLVNKAASIALVAASEAADLLVVGSRGHGGFAGLLLGSVGQQCAHHAHCPVVIVRGSKAA